jgi:hypothetical protein
MRGKILVCKISLHSSRCRQGNLVLVLISDCINNGSRWRTRCNSQQVGNFVQQPRQRASGRPGNWCRPQAIIQCIVARNYGRPMYCVERCSYSVRVFALSGSLWHNLLKSCYFFPVLLLLILRGQRGFYRVSALFYLFGIDSFEAVKDSFKGIFCIYSTVFP